MKLKMIKNVSVRMKKLSIKKSISILFIGGILVSAQDRTLINDGVEKYNEGRFKDAEINFKKSLSESPESYIANFNLGDAYYKQQKFDEAVESYNKAAALSRSNKEKADAYHNIGNSFLQEKKYKESVEAYKNALKLNPGDAETKYNLSYALKMMQQDQDDQNKNKDKQKDQNQKKDEDQKQNQNQDQKKDQDQKQDQDQDKKDDKEQQKKDQNDQQQNKDEESKQDNTKQQPGKNEISKEQAERILDALKNNEKDLQKKLRKQKAKVVKTEKDW